MTLRIVFRPAAKREFNDAADRYEAQRSGLGEEFIIEIDQAVAKAESNPEHCPIVFGDVRRAVARRFPFSVYFRIRRKTMVVLAVFHGRRNPVIWQRRV
ncbi:MAG: type II toxin-antitoxin system RelE/ParE family toxin [Burkholderiales bacterium]